MNSKKIQWELTETINSDIPLLKTVTELRRQNNNCSDFMTFFEHHNNGLMSGDAWEASLQVFEKINVYCNAIEELARLGIQQAKDARFVAQQAGGIGSRDLSQTPRDYEAIAQLLTEFTATHGALMQNIAVFVEQQNDDNVAVHIHTPMGLSHSHTAAIVHLADLQALSAKTALILNELYLHLGDSIDSSLDAAMDEQYKLQRYNLLFFCVTLGFGSVFTALTIKRFSKSLAPVTQKAHWISQHAQDNKDDWWEERLTTEEIALAIAAGEEVAELSHAFNQIVNSLATSRIQQAAIEQQLAQETQLISFTLKSIGDGVITTNPKGIITSANKATEELIGCPSSDMIGKTLTSLLINHELPENEYLHSVYPQECQRLTVKNRHGESKIFDISSAPILSGQGAIIGDVFVFRDMTQLLDATKELSWQASHDPLTQLANRREFQTQLELLSQMNVSGDAAHAILYLDLDRFKIVNDTCGHDAGDELLKQISRRIGGDVQETDIVARLGGDEFGVILKNCSLEGAIATARQILTTVQKYRFIWQEHQFSLGISIGVVTYCPKTDDPVIVMKAADAACYEAKNQGRNQIYTVIDKHHHLAGQNREMNWLATIHQALETDHFCLYQQKITALDPTKASHQHFEILLRLTTADGSVLSPGAFLPIAERYQLMTKIDRWVISHFFKSQHSYLRAMWRDCPTDNPAEQNFYSLNLSADSLNDPTFLPFLEAQFTIYQVPPELICFEITETVAIANLHRATQIIRAIKNLGCRFALDDFGSGMSSFGYLQTLPVDFLKIDGVFIRELCQNSMNEIIVEALHQVAKAVNIKTIAEFVQDEVTIQKLRDIGIDYAQGYGIDRPRPLRQMHVIPTKIPGVAPIIPSTINELNS